MSAADWLTSSGLGFSGAVLGYLVPAIITRKKDSGELASDMLTKTLKRIEKLEADSVRCERETGELRIVITRNDLVIRLVVPELQRVAPYSTALAQARNLLGGAFPVDRTIPPETGE